MPSARQLKPELVHLVHHVELADAGWRVKLGEQLIVARLLIELPALTTVELRTWLKSEYGSTIDDATFSAAMGRLLRAKRLHELDNGRLKLSEEERAEAAARISAGSELLAKAKARFVELFEHLTGNSSTEQAWEQFCSELIDPLISELGARTYNLLAGVPTSIDGVRSLSAYVRSFPEARRTAIGNAIDAYFDPNCEDSRSFILQRLYSHLLASAASLDADTLDSIARARQKRLQVKLFVDTNFLFSLLDLHDNPADDAATELMAVLRAVGNQVDFRLYVIPLTIDEARRTLGSYDSQLSAMAVTSRLGRIAIEVDEGLSGISLRYLRAVRESGHRLTAQEYFRPYLEDLLSILRAKGIELFNEDCDKLSMESGVIDDIVDQQRIEERRGKKGKKYEAIRHDVSLWHCVARKRAGRVDSPLEAGFWIATIDYRFIAFDALKQRTLRSTAPVCVHPAVLVQMLQLWLPRNPAVERAMLQSLRSMLPQTFDAETEQVTIRILRALSRFENVDDLPEDAISAVLVNRALRSRMRSTEASDEQLRLVRDAIIEEAAQIRGDLDTERKRRKELEHLIELRESDSRVREGERERERGEFRIAHGQLVAELDKARVEREQLLARVGVIEGEKRRWEDAEAKRTQKRERHRRRSFVAASMLGMVAALAGANAAVTSWGRAWAMSRAALAIAAVWVLVVVVMDAIGNRMQEVRDWPPYRRLHQARKLLIGFAGLIMVGAMVELVIAAF